MQSLCEEQKFHSFALVLYSRIHRTTLQHRIWTKNQNYNIACMLHWMWSKRSVPSAKRWLKTPEICTLAYYTQPNIIRCMLSADASLWFCSIHKLFDFSREKTPTAFLLSSSYGYVTNSKVKFIIVVDSTNTALRENDVRTVIAS